MSVEQGAAFAQELVVLVDQYKIDAQAILDTYEEAIEGAAQEVVDESHTFAIDMTARMNKLTIDVQTLYQETYPEGVPDVGEPDEEQGIEGA